MIMALLGRSLIAAPDAAWLAKGGRAQYNQVH